jgi:hypothetical protein
MLKLFLFRHAQSELNLLGSEIVVGRSSEAHITGLPFVSTSSRLMLFKRKDKTKQKD